MTDRKAPACLAPPITPEVLARYKTLVPADKSPLADAMTQYITMVETFQQTPRSTLPPERVPMRGMKDGVEFTGYDCVPLEPAEVERIWGVVPWEHEIVATLPLLRALPPGELRDAFQHLRWYARELTRDREPMTNDFI